MATYYPNIDPTYLFKRQGTANDPFIPLVQNITVKTQKVTLKEIPSYTEKVKVSFSNGNLLNEVTGSTINAGQYRVDYTTGIVQFNSSENDKELKFEYLGTGHVNIGANRIMLNTSATNNEEVSVQEIIDDQVDLYAKAVESKQLIESNQAAKKSDLALTNAQLAHKASKNYVDAQLTNIGNASPKGAYASLTALETAFPNGSPGIYVVTENGRWYFWNGLKWTDGGLYQATLSTEFIGQNKVNNGNFTNTTGWTGQGTTVSVNSNILTGTATGQLSFIRIYSTTDNRKLRGAKNKKIYARASMMVEDSVSKLVKMNIQNTTTSYGVVFQQPTPSINQWYSLSGVMTLHDSTDTLDLGYAFHSDYASAEESNGKKLNVRYVLVVDLSETFGYGNEPTKEEMDAILSKYPNSFFTGSVSPLINQKELYLSLKSLAKDEPPVIVEPIKYQDAIWGSKNRMLYSGHRGYSGIAPESTIPAFELSGQNGHDCVEVDVAPTADGDFVISHDATIDRLTNGTGVIKDLTVAQIKSFSVDYGVNISNYPNLKIPTLTEYLTVCKKWGMIPLLHIENFPDDTSSSIYQTFLNVLIKKGFEKKCIVSSANINKLRKLRELSKLLPLQTLVGFLGNAVIDTAVTLGNANICFNKDGGTLNQSAVEYAHQKGIHVVSFTVNDKQTEKEFLEKGVDMIITDQLKFEHEA